jgi:hypothetical protein
MHVYASIESHIFYSVSGTLEIDAHEKTLKIYVTEVKTSTTRIIF